MSREIFYEYSASAVPPDPTVNSTKYVAPLAYANGYYKAIARENGDLSDVTSVSFGMEVVADYIAYYKFDGNTNDETGNFNATNYGATLTTGVKGVTDTAYYFNGNNANMEIPVLPIGSSFSISLWVNIDTLSNAGSFVDNLAGNYATGFAFGYKLFGNTTGISFYNSNSSWITTGESLTLYSWVHVVLVINGANSQIYVDKVSKVTFSCNYTNNTDVMKIGLSYECGRLKGKIDNIRIYDKAITQYEIDQINDLEKL